MVAEGCVGITAENQVLRRRIQDQEHTILIRRAQEFLYLSRRARGTTHSGSTSQDRRFLDRRIEEWRAAGRRASTGYIAVAELRQGSMCDR